MKMALVGNDLYISQMDSVQYQTIVSWGKSKWNRAKQALIGTADIEYLGLLSSIVRLPEAIQKYYDSLLLRRRAVDAERNKEHPSHVYEYPVKVKLYEHQERAANMAQVVFGWLEPEVLSP